MSILKSKKFYICIILAFFTLLIFGCENRTPVENIAFREDEIVLLVGESYTPQVVVNPSYATDSSYTLTSSNSSIISVNGRELLAMGEGNATVRVCSNDKSLLEDVITVTVRRTKSVLTAPRNLTYNQDSQTFTFDTVNNATSYTIKINGYEINLGNSNSYSLAQFNLEYANAFDTVLTAQVMAKAPAYSQAFVDSTYSSEISIFQNSPIGSAQISNGILTFEKNPNSDTYSILLNGEEYELSSDTTVDLTNIPEKYAGQDVTVGIVSKVNSEVKTQNAENVTYYDSKSFDIRAYALDVVNPNMSVSTISWNNVNNAGGYTLYIDDVNSASTTHNYFDLRTLEEFDSIINKDGGYTLRVEPVIAENSVNILKSSKQGSALQFNRFDAPILSASNNLISWQVVDDANSYIIELIADEHTLRTSTSATSFSLANYPAGESYQFNIYVEGSTIDGMYYLASDVASLTIDKQAQTELEIVDYQLTFPSAVGERYKIEFKLSDGSSVQEEVVSDSDVVEFDLSNYTFASGENEVVVTHLGDGSLTFDGNPDTISFVQLESIDDIQIENGNVSVEISEINESADIIFEISGTKGTKVETVESEFSLNSTDPLGENYLQSDEYTLSLYVKGNGSTTFSPNGKSENATATRSFVVLDVPTVSIEDKDQTSLSISTLEGASKFNIYTLNQGTYEFDEEVDENIYNFSLDSGEMRIKIQSVGDGTNNLNSRLSQEITIIRLNTPNLSYNNATDVITKTDNNPSEYIDSFTFTLNGENNDYAFDGTAFTDFVVGDNVLTLKANAIDAESNVYYLNSEEFELTVNMIDSTASITINSNNQLVITPNNQTEEYELSLSITIDDEMLFEGADGELKYNDYTLNYTYSSETNSYTIDLLQEDYTPVILEMTKDFSVKVKFVKPSTPDGEDQTANSVFTAEQSVRVLNETTAGREDQYITIAKLSQTDTSLNYALLINDKYRLDLNSQSSSAIVDDVDNMQVKVHVDYIYQYIEENIPTEEKTDIYDIAVISVNINSREDNLELSVVGEDIKITQITLPDLISTKDNATSDNSVKISFNTVATEYAKEYVVQIYNSNGDSSHIERRYSDSEVVENSISFDLDDYDLTGSISVSYYIATSGQYNIDAETIYVFNSSVSNVLEFTKVDSVKNIIVSDGLVIFDCVEHAVGYEIYKETSSGYEKINTNLITSTTDTASYNLGEQNGSMRIFVKSISEEEAGGVKYTNSNLSTGVNVNKLATPVFSVVDSGADKGKITLSLSDDAVTLMQDGTIDCVVSVTNGSAVYDFTTETEGVTMAGNKLYIEPSLVLSYGVGSLLKETLSIYIKVNYLDANQNIYYLNSNTSTQDVYGLIAPNNIQKYTSQTDAVDVLEHISWQGSQYNILDGSDVGYGYILRLEYVEGENTIVRYSTDKNLKFLSSSDVASLSEYPDIIEDTNIIFPYAYDSNGDGSISDDEIFTSGTYHISVKAVPKFLAGYNILSSGYSSDYTVHIMATPMLMLNEGTLLWQADERASNYIVRIYDTDFTTVIDQEVVTDTEFNFSNSLFDGYSGFYGVSVQSVSDENDTLNSEISEVMSIFRLPMVDSVTVDDGSLVITANRFFSSAEIEFVDISNGRTEVLTFARYVEASEELNTLKIEQQINEWSELGQEQIEALVGDMTTLNKYIVTISDSDILNILADRSYTINIRLKGNSEENFAIINSIKADTVSHLQGTKVDTNIFEVTKGVLQFTTSEAYDSMHLNYNFNNQDILDENSFWNDTIVYKITVTTPEVYEIYAIDYYRFLTAISNSTLSSDEYTILEESISNLYAYVKFEYTDDANETKYLYFNVFYENKINLKDYNTLYYYPINVTIQNGEYSYSGVETERDYAEIDISGGGSFVIKVNILGGDSIITRGSDSQISSHKAYLTANTNTSNTFVRYSENILSSYLGRIRMNNQSPTNEETGEVIDRPLYELTITRLNTQDTKIVYLYYDDEASARSIIDDPDAIYVQIIYDEMQAVLFDMSNCLDQSGNYIFSAGSYQISVRTIAGLGNATVENSSDYLLNSKNPNNSYLFSKITDTSIYAEDGVLKFSQSSFSSENTTVYIYDYELTITDDAGTSYTYEISRDSEGVSIDSINHIVTYELPSSIEDSTGRVLYIENTQQYSIKVKGLAGGNQRALNASYIKDNGVDRQLEFAKSSGISTVNGENLRIEDGVLKWKVLDLNSYTTVSIEVSFFDQNNQRKSITISTSGDRYDEDGTYQYHYYTFLDDRYRLDDGTGMTYIDAGVDYSVRLYVAGTSNGERAVLNSNYSESIFMTRLDRVLDSELKSQDGILTWNDIYNAINYIVTLTSSAGSFEFEVSENSIDFENAVDSLGRALPVGQYSVGIRAIGEDSIHSRTTSSTNTFTKLDVVQSIGVDSTNPNNITWEKNEDAQGYWVKFEYTNAGGELVTYEETLVGSEQNSISAPDGMIGQYTVSIRAIGVGDGYVFNSGIATYTSSKDRPNPVGTIVYDEENYRYYWTTASDFGDGDKLHIVYQFRPFVESADGIVLDNERRVEVVYNYNQVGTFFVSNEITYYFYAPTVMGTISDFTVQVEREGTLYSTTSRGQNITMDMYSLGSGTAEDPYGIDSAIELLRIDHFNSANFKLISAINFAGTNVADLITSQGSIISSSFSGTLDGQGFAIYGFGSVAVSEVSQFALFNALNGATIKNIVFGEANLDTIISYSFASTNDNVINLSLIANNANNSTIEDITLHNFKFVLQGNGRLTENIYIGGLIGISENTTISGSILEVEVQFDVDFTSRNSYIGGIVGNATGTTINSSSTRATSVEFAITQSKTNRTFSHIGGLIGYLIGDSDRNTGIFNATSYVTFNNIYASNLGGVVGFISRARVEDSTSNGSIVHTGINNDTNIGAIAGTSQSGIILGNTINLTYDIGIINSTSSSIYIGAVAGRLTTIDSMDCQVTDCVVAYEFINETSLSSTGIIAIGLYGYSSQTNVIVSGNTYIE